MGEQWAYCNTGYLLVRQAVERATRQEIDAALRGLVFEPLGLERSFVVQSVGDLDDCLWLAGRGYDPKWVYHGLVVGPVADACRFIHAVGTGRLLSKECDARLRQSVELGGPVPDRPWARAAYGLGVMNGDYVDLGNCIGHSGNGPGSVCAVYHVAGVSVCAFGPEEREDGVEWETHGMALDLTWSG